MSVETPTLTPEFTVDEVRRRTQVRAVPNAGMGHSARLPGTDTPARAIYQLPCTLGSGIFIFSSSFFDISNKYFVIISSRLFMNSSNFSIS